MKPRLMLVLLMAVFVNFVQAADKSSLTKGFFTNKQLTEVEYNLAQHHINDMLLKSTKRAYKQIEETGVFSPYVSVVTRDGEVELYNAINNEDDRDIPVSTAVALLKGITQRLFVNKGKYITAGIFAPVRAKHPVTGKVTTAMSIEIEHLSGIAFLRILPYEIDEKTKKIILKKALDKGKAPSMFNELIEAVKKERSR